MENMNDKPNWLGEAEEVVAESDGKQFEDWQRDYYESHKTPLMRWLMYEEITDNGIRQDKV